MRVIAGIHKSRRLLSLDIKGVRPTQDRIKEAIFSMLGHDRFDSFLHVWDLFSGFGGLGIEALSRGAKRVTFVEQHADVFKVLRDNLSSLGLLAFAQTIKGDAFKLALTLAPANLILLDPPYAQFENTIHLIGQIIKHQLLLPWGVLVFETGREYLAEPALLDLFASMNDSYVIIKQRSYGDTQVLIIQHQIR